MCWTEENILAGLLGTSQGASWKNIFNMHVVTWDILLLLMGFNFFPYFSSRTPFDSLFEHSRMGTAKINWRGPSQLNLKKLENAKITNGANVKTTFWN